MKWHRPKWLKRLPYDRAQLIRNRRSILVDKLKEQTVELIDSRFSMRIRDFATAVVSMLETTANSVIIWNVNCG